MNGRGGRRVFRLLPAAVLLLGGCALAGSAVTGGEHRFTDHTFSRDTVLSGTNYLAGECLVPAGVTLRINPGASLLFLVEDRDGDGLGDSRLRVEGRILAVGKPEAPILLSSAGDARGERHPGDWEGILLNFSRESEFRYLVLEYSNYGLHAHFSRGTVARCLIRRNNEGCRMGNCSFTLEENLVRDNLHRGFNLRACENVIRHNEITANGNGIFLFEKDAGSVIMENNIHGNERYNLRLDDFFAGRIVLEGNWWDSPDEEEIRQKVYDSRDDPEIGTAVLKPSASPVRMPGGFPFTAGGGGTGLP